MGPVYYCPGHPSNTISLGAFKCYVGFQRVTSEILNIVILLTLKIVLGCHPTRLRYVLAMCYATSYPFGCPSRRKQLPLEVIKILVTKFRNQDRKLAFIQVYEYGALERSSRFMRTCHKMNIIVQTTSRDASSINGKNEIPNKTLDNITRYLLMNSIHKK